VQQITTDEGLGFQRLHALSRGGYVPQIGADVDDSSILLDHVGKGPRLRLFPDGSITVLDRNLPVHAEGNADRYRIQADDDLNFGKFARLVGNMPRKKRGRWRKRFGFLVVMAGLWGGSLALTAAVTSM
jgi:hypothetical protein